MRVVIGVLTANSADEGVEYVFEKEPDGTFHQVIFSELDDVPINTRIALWVVDSTNDILEAYYDPSGKPVWLEMN